MSERGDPMIESGGKGRPKIDEFRPTMQFPEAGRAGGARDWGKVLRDLELLTTKSKEELRKLGASKGDRNRAASELGQEGFTPGNLRDLDARAEARTILERVEKTPEAARQGDAWEALQDRAVQIFGTGIDLGEVAEVYDQRRAEAEALELTAAALETTPKIEVQPVPEAIVEPVFYPRILDDLEIATQPFQRIKGLTDANDLRLARLHNARIQEAIDNLDAAGVNTAEFVGKGDEARRVKNRLTVAVTRLQLAREGGDISPEDIQRSANFLSSLGIDTTQIVLPVVGEEKLEAPSEGSKEKKTKYETDLEGSLRMAGGNPDAVRQALRGWMSRYSGDAGAGRVPPEVIQRAQDMLAEADSSVQKIRNQSRFGASVFGKSPEELAALGIETTATRDDLLMRELRRPILGDEVVPEYGERFNPLLERRRAVAEDEAFSEKRVAELLAEVYSSYLKSYNGEVTNKSELDVRVLGSVDAELRRRSTDIEAQIKKAIAAGSGHLVFKSLIPFANGTDPLSLSEVVEKMMGVGFGRLTEAERRVIPEVRALESIQALLSWNDAQTELIRTLQSIRSYGVAKEIDTMAALGKNPDRLVMKTSSVVKLWSIEGLSRDERKADSEWVADSTEAATRIYGLIAEAAVEVPGSETGGEGERMIKQLVRQHLTDRDLVTEGARPTDVTFVLNRFGQNLSPERLAKVEAFVNYLVKNKILYELGRPDGSIDVTRVNADLDREIRMAKEEARKTTLNPGEVTVKSNREREVGLGIDNAVALIHVTGLADTWSGYCEWAMAKDDDPPSLPSYGDPRMVGRIRVGGYPACTAGAEVANYKRKLIADLIEKKLSVSRVLIDEIANLPDNLAYNYLQSTTINDGGVVKSLWVYWHDEGESLRQVARQMIGRVPENAIQGYFNSIASAKSLADLLKGTDPSLLKDITEGGKGQGKIQVALKFGLGMPFGPARTAVADRLKAIIYAGPLLYSLGFTDQLTASDVVTKLEDTKLGSSAEGTMRDTLRHLIKDAIASAKPTDLLPGLRTAEFARLKTMYRDEVVGAMSLESLRTFAQIVDRYYRQRRNGIGVTGRKGLNPAVLRDVTDNPHAEQNIPYAKIWKNLIGST